MISMPISQEELNAQTTSPVPVESNNWYNYFSNKITSVGQSVGLTTDANKAATEGGAASTPGVTGFVKGLFGADTNAAEKTAEKVSGDPIGAVSASWQKFGNETIVRVVLAALALMIVYLALRKMV